MKKPNIKNLQLFGMAVAMAMCIISTVSCKQKKQEEDYIIEEQVESTGPKATQEMSPRNSEVEVQWGENNYTVKINSKADKSLPEIEDKSTGDKYYDNVFTVVVAREDGTEAINKTFTKEFFKSNVDSKMYDSYGLTNIMFNDADNSNLNLIVCVGDPDPSSENFSNFMMSISKTGETKVRPYVIDEKTGSEADLELVP